MLTCTPKSSDQNTIYFGLRVKPKIIKFSQDNVSTMASVGLLFPW